MLLWKSGQKPIEIETKLISKLSCIFANNIEFSIKDLDQKGEQHKENCLQENKKNMGKNGNTHIYSTTATTTKIDKVLLYLFVESHIKSEERNEIIE